MACILIRRGENAKGKWNEALLLIPAVLLSFMAFTNDPHRLVYVPEIPLQQFTVDSGTYGGGGVALIGITLISLLTGLFG